MRRFSRVACVIALAACSKAVYGPRLHAPTAAPPPAAVHDGVLKVHLMSGELVVLDHWHESDSTLAGPGKRYGLERELLSQGDYQLPFDSIALLESRVRIGSRPTAVAGMAVWTTLWGLLTVGCVADPKSCFGSCPTFYVAADSGEALVAEGFSASIARVLEAKDLDALAPARARSGPFVVRMRNEAMETHAVRSVALRAAPRPAGGHLFASASGELWPAAMMRAATRCRAAEGDCLAALAALDGVERASPADSVDLAAQETIELTFPAATGRLGFVIGARQSLMTTYLFYQTMGFLGERAGEGLAALERGGRAVAERAMGMARLIGPVEIEVLEDDRWLPIGRHDEAGPLATHVEVLPFARQGSGPVRVRVRAARGAWRFDWIALAELGEPVEAITLSPEAALREGRPDSVALARLQDPAAHLFTYPGDVYDLVFRLPQADAEWELFLESEGYYYEWMRSEWLADEDPALAALALTDPAAALRVLAPAFKRAEPEMERLFWSSRFGR